MYYENSSTARGIPGKVRFFSLIVKKKKQVINNNTNN